MKIMRIISGHPKTLRILFLDTKGVQWVDTGTTPANGVRSHSRFIAG